MATFVLKDAVVSINAVDLSDHVRSVSITYEADQVDDTNMGDTTKQRLAGLLEWSVEIEFAQDFAAGEVDATLFPLVGAAPFEIKIRPTSGAIAATNPEYVGNAVLPSYTPIDGSVGDLATTSVEFVSSGTLTRDTTP